MMDNTDHVIEISNKMWWEDLKSSSGKGRKGTLCVDYLCDVYIIPIIVTDVEMHKSQFTDPIVQL